MPVAAATLLDEGWEMALAAPGAASCPAGLPCDLDWIAARVPGTAAQALMEAGRWTSEAAARLREQDVWYRCNLTGTIPGTLRFEGLAGLAEVWLGDEVLLRSTSMFVAQEVPAALREGRALHIRFGSSTRAPVPRMGRARWRPRLVSTQALRVRRATLLGHMPGWCPDIPPIGPFRPILRLADDRAIRSCRLGATLSGDVGHLRVALEVSVPPGREATLVVGGRRFAVTPEGCGLEADLVLPGVQRWWPHTHGAPVLHDVVLELGSDRHDLGRVGFRSIEVDRGSDGHGFGLVVNGVPVFARGACWTSARLSDLASTREACEGWLRLARDGGMNMIRVPGIMAYEGPAFHALCDELGLLVWQDLMLANFDYPQEDPVFLREVTTEVEQLLERLSSSPSLAVLCGGSEVAQQAAMLGLPAEARLHSVFDTLIPELAARLRPDVVCLPNTPIGGDVPFREDAGVAHYYGVGAYRRPLEDARRSGLRFAAECLAFAQVPDAQTLAEALPGIVPHHPDWKARVPRDPGAGWDFEDVRDHYLALLYGVDPVRLRSEDVERYLELSRAVGADVLELAFAEWRRPVSSCRGALVWQLQDLQPGAGWGIVDALGRPKAAWHGLRRVLAPVQVLLADEGLNGLDVHVLNEADRPLDAVLALACLRDGAVPLVQGERVVSLPPRGVLTLSDAALFGAFFDTTYARRFGPRMHDVTLATLWDPDRRRVLSQAFHFPAGRALPPRDLGLEATLVAREDGWSLRLACRSLAVAVHVEVAGFRAETDWFHLAPGQPRMIRLLPLDGAGGVPRGEVRALNALHAVGVGGP